MAIVKTSSNNMSKDLAYRTMYQLARAFDRAERSYRTHSMAAARARETTRTIAEAIATRMSDVARTY